MSYSEILSLFKTIFKIQTSTIFVSSILSTNSSDGCKHIVKFVKLHTGLPVIMLVLQYLEAFPIGKIL